VTELF